MPTILDNTALLYLSSKFTVVKIIWDALLKIHILITNPWYSNLESQNLYFQQGFQVILIQMTHGINFKKYQSTQHCHKCILLLQFAVFALPNCNSLCSLLLSPLVAPQQDLQSVTNSINSVLCLKTVKHVTLIVKIQIKRLGCIQRGFP